MRVRVGKAPGSTLAPVTARATAVVAPASQAVKPVAVVATGTGTSRQPTTSTAATSIAAAVRAQAAAVVQAATFDSTTQITVRSVTTAASTADVASIAINVPFGVQNGDVLILGIVTNDGGTPAAVTGFTEDQHTTNGSGGTGVALSVWHRVASSEPASYTLTLAATGPVAAEMVCYKGIDNGTPVEASAIAAGGAGSTYSATVLAEPSLVSYWRMGEAAGSTVVDQTGTNNGTYAAGVTLAQTGMLTGDTSTAALFNGSTGYIYLSGTTGIVTGAGARSWEWLAKTTAVAKTPIFRYGTGVAEEVVDIAITAGQVVVDFWSDSHTFGTASQVNNGAAHRVLVTLTGTTLTCSIDGVAASGSPATTGAVNTVLGGNQWICTDGSNFSAITLEEVATYSAALSSVSDAAHQAAMTGAGGASSSVSTPTVTTATANAMVVRIPVAKRGASGDPVFSANPGFTVETQKVTPAGGNPTRAIGYEDALQLNAGAAGVLAVASNITPDFALYPIGATLSLRSSAAVVTHPPFTGWQSMNDAANPGDTIYVPAGTYHERPTLNKQGTIWLCEPGVLLDFTGLGVPLQSGGLTFAAPQIQVQSTMPGTQGLSLQNSDGAAFKITVDGILLTDFEAANNYQEAYEIYGGTGIVITRMNDHHNNVANRNLSGAEQGGGKALLTTNMILDSCQIHDNGGPGPWFDTYPTPNTLRNGGAVVRNCRIYNNTYAGIMWEISVNAVFHDNVLWNNGDTLGGWDWNASILCSSSQNMEAYNNIIAWSPCGIAVISQARADKPANQAGFTENSVNNYIHDNTLIGNTVQFAFDQDWVGGLFDPAANNHASNNSYWASGASVFHWNGGTQNTPLGGGTALTTAQAQAILAANGMPLSQPTRPI